MDKKPGWGCSHGYYGTPHPDCDQCQRTGRLWDRVFIAFAVAMLIVSGLVFWVEHRYGKPQWRCPCCGHEQTEKPNQTTRKNAGF